MCFACHINLSDEQVYNSLNIDDLKFYMWNSTSIFHIMIASSGFNGEKVRELGLKSLDKYYKWLLKNPTRASCGLGKRTMKNKINYLKTHTTVHKDYNKLEEFLIAMK